MTFRYGFRVIRVDIENWFLARAAAAIALHCEPGQLVVVKR